MGATTQRSERGATGGLAPAALPEMTKTAWIQKAGATPIKGFLNEALGSEVKAV